MPQLFRRTLEISRLPQSDSQAVIGVRKIRIEANCLLPFRNRCWQVVGEFERQRKVMMQARFSGIEFQCCAKLYDCSRKVRFLQISRSQVSLEPGIVWMKLDRLLKFLDSRVRVSTLQHGKRKIIVGLRVAGNERHCLAKCSHCAL